MEVYDVHVFEARAKQRLQKFLGPRGSILRVQRTLSLCSHHFNEIPLQGKRGAHTVAVSQVVLCTFKCVVFKLSLYKILGALIFC